MRHDDLKTQMTWMTQMTQMTQMTWITQMTWTTPIWPKWPKWQEASQTIDWWYIYIYLCIHIQPAALVHVFKMCNGNGKYHVNVENHPNK